MALRKLKPYSPGTRHATMPDFAEVTRNRPEKSLTEVLKKHSGRNNQGRITVRHRGGGHRRLYRIIDFKRNKLDIEGLVKHIEYDPNRNCRIALIHYMDGEKRYVLAAKGMQQGQRIVSSNTPVEPTVGNAMRLRDIPQGMSVHNVEMSIGHGGQIARSAGTHVRLMAIDGNQAVVLLPSGELRRLHADCRATIGEVGNSEFNLRSLGKAGRKRWLGIRPTVRGNAMNPVAHPLGGGEGHSNGGRQHCSPTGLIDGVKTRKRNKPSSALIIRRRKK
ncbi:MAG: 50S ribosomal protein L2 [Planctomycetota bacterium]|nr:MAG: 50S ribosomal protein L2 [Planctomycetota bacterium]